MEQIDDVATAASYDALNRLVSQQAGGGLHVRGQIDEPASATVNGKPVSVTVGGSFDTTVPTAAGTNTMILTATDGSGNQATNVYQVDMTGSSKTLTYDANGLLIADERYTYNWDALNRLIGVNNNSVMLATFAYDGKGRRR